MGQGSTRFSGSTRKIRFPYDQKHAVVLLCRCVCARQKHLLFYIGYLLSSSRHRSINCRKANTKPKKKKKESAHRKKKKEKQTCHCNLAGTQNDEMKKKKN